MKRYIMVNKEFIQVFNGEAMVSKKDIARMLKISRPTLNKWIKDGFITPVKSKIINNLEIFPPDIILEQLLNQKNRK
jgi:predicted site-specific integrase-resolvase